MPATFQGGTDGTSYARRRPDRWLRYRLAYPPDSNIRGSDDTPGARCPYNTWFPPDCIGDETTGMAVTKSYAYDDDLAYRGGKGGSKTISGRCLDEVGAAVSGATVELWIAEPDWPDAGGPWRVGVTVCNGDGNYGFAVSDSVKKYFVTAYISTKGGVTIRNLTGA